MLAAFFTEIDHRLGFIPRTSDVNHDALTKNGVFDTVPDAQTNFLSICLLWRTLRG